MKILLTGGAGYIGSHTAVALLEAGHDAAVVDNYSNSSPEAVRRAEQITGKEIRLYEADVADKRFANLRAARGIDAVYEPDAAHVADCGRVGVAALGAGREREQGYRQDSRQQNRQDFFHALHDSRTFHVVHAFSLPFRRINRSSRPHG